MKYRAMSLVASTVLGGTAFAAESGSAAAQLQFFQKNVARHHVGSNLFLFNSNSHRYEPTEAAAAWLDDDITTGAPIMAGKQHYMVTLAEPETLQSFGLSARAASGTISIFVGDEPAAPGARSWTAISRDLPLESVNNRKLSGNFNKLGKYFLIETNIAEPGPLYSLFLYGEKPSVSYDLHQRETPLNTREVFGAFVNPSASISLTGLYSDARVDFVNSPEGFKAWQAAIDDNPATTVQLGASADEAAMIVRLNEARQVSRVALMAASPVKGKLEVYALPAASSEYGKSVKLDKVTPAVTLVLDGSNPRASLDFPAVSAGAIALRWTPESGETSLALREFEVFGAATIANSEVSLSPEAVAAFGADRGRDPSKDGKSMRDSKDPKEVALGPSSPYLPGSLGFPPNIDRNRIPAVNPPTPVLSP